MQYLRHQPETPVACEARIQSGEERRLLEGFEGSQVEVETPDAAVVDCGVAPIVGGIGGAIDVGCVAIRPCSPLPRASRATYHPSSVHAFLRRARGARVVQLPGEGAVRLTSIMHCACAAAARGAARQGQMGHVPAGDVVHQGRQRRHVCVYGGDGRMRGERGPTRCCRRAA